MSAAPSSWFALHGFIVRNFLIKYCIFHVFSFCILERIVVSCCRCLMLFFICAFWGQLHSFNFIYVICCEFAWLQSSFMVTGGLSIVRSPYTLTVPYNGLPDTNPVFTCHLDSSMLVFSLIFSNMLSKYTWNWGNTCQLFNDRIVCTDLAWLGDGLNKCP